MSLPDGISIHHVHLKVRDLDRAVSFYRSVIGLALIGNSGVRAEMSASGKPPAQLILTESSDAKPRNPRSPGLFHVAWRVPDRSSLATTIRHFRDTRTRLQGFADHGVSEAVYLGDPEGNGIEIYRDRRREEWLYRDGHIEMVTDPLDLEDLLREPPEPHVLSDRTVIGHIHLQVSDLHTGREFYQQGLGFDVMQDSFPGALFLAAGGYHHHIGLNTWNSRGAAPPSGNNTGLVSFGIAVPGDSSLDGLRKRIHTGAIDVDSPDALSLMVRDPDRLQIEILQQTPLSSPLSESHS